MKALAFDKCFAEIFCLISEDRHYHFVQIFDRLTDVKHAKNVAARLIELLTSRNSARRGCQFENLDSVPRLWSDYSASCR